MEQFQIAWDLKHENEFTILNFSNGLKVLNIYGNALESNPFQ